MKYLKSPWLWAAAGGVVVYLVWGSQIAAALGLSSGDAPVAGSSNATSPDVRSGSGQDQGKPSSSNGAKPSGAKS